jgi:hypothetical protein
VPQDGCLREDKGKCEGRSDREPKKSH